MKINVRYFILIVFLLFLGIVKVEAEIFQCEYYFGKEAGYEYVFEYDNEQGTVKNLDEKEDFRGTSISQNFIYEYIFMEGEIKQYKKGECPILYMKSVQDIDDGGGETGTITYTYSFYSDSFIREESGIDECVSNRDEICLGKYFGADDVNYYTGTLKEDSEINKDNKNVSKCISYDKIEQKIIEYYEKYKNCDSSNCASSIAAAEKKIDEIRNLCSSMFAYRDVYIDTGAEQTQDICILSCFNLNTRIDALKKDYGIKGKEELGQCGFSWKLINWIANIVKWIKYIVPVIVIVMGILDFIKALSTGKEDEMKKAQGHFIKRLIAAALIFITPFIIEFVLNKMGFDANGCGIIDL